MASGTIDHTNVVQGSRATEFYFDFASGGLPYIRWKNQSGHNYQLITNETQQSIRLETNRSGSWETIARCYDYQKTFYVSGDTFTSPSGGLPVTGYITGAGKTLCLTIPLPKMTNLVSSASITTISGGLRIPTGGYVQNDSFNYLSYVGNIRLLGCFLFVQLDKSDGWGTTNNIPINGGLSFSCSFS